MEWRIVDHGVDGSQYFPGHGVAFTRYTHTVTGCGDTASEALDDALEQLGDALPEGAEGVVEEIERSDDAQALRNSVASAHADCRGPRGGRDLSGAWHDGCELYWYVSIDVLVPVVPRVIPGATGAREE